MNDSKPHLLTIGGWTETIQAAIDAGFDVTYIGPTNGGAGLDLAQLALCTRVEEAKMDEVGVCLALARRIHAEHPFTAVVSLNEFGLETAAVIADALGVAGAPLWPVVITRYKDHMRRALIRHPELSLSWAPVTGRQALMDFYERSGPAIIVKPVAGAGSAGVHQVRDATEFQALIDDFDWGSATPYIAEELVDSDELFSVETLSVEGRHHVIALSLSKLVGYPYSLQNYIIVPPPRLSLDEAKLQRIAEFVRDFLDAIGLNWGPAHTEVKIAKDGRIGIIESQTRVGGDRIWLMTSLTTGFEQVDAVFATLLRPDETVPHLPEPKSAAAFVCILPPPGTVRSCADPELLRLLDGVQDVEIKIESGEKITPITDNIQRRGHILIHRRNQDEVFDTMDAIARTYWVEYDDGHVWHPEFVR